MIVIGDIGSAKALLPIIQWLFAHHEKYKINVVADDKGKGVQILKKSPYGYLPFSAVNQSPFMNHWNQYPPDLVLIGTSATAITAQVKITELAQDKDIPVVWLEDFWGTANNAGVKKVTPDYLFVLDSASPGRNNAQKFITGNPAFDQLANWNVAEIRQRRRQEMGISMDQKVVTFFGPGYSSEYPARLFEAVALLAPTLTEQKALFLPIFHPKDETLGPGFEAMFRNWAAKPKNAPFPVRLDAYAFVNDPTELVCVSDVTAAISSTELLSACLLKVPAVSVIGRQGREFLQSLGMGGGLPCVRNNSVESLDDTQPTSLTRLLGNKVYRDAVIAYQQQSYPNDGSATDRVIARINQILGL